MFKPGESCETLGLAGSEIFSVSGISGIKPRKSLNVKAVKKEGKTIDFDVTARLDTDIDVEYFEHGGIMPYVLRKLMR